MILCDLFVGEIRYTLRHDYAVAGVYVRSAGRFCATWQAHGPGSVVPSDDDTEVVERKHGARVRRVEVDDVPDGAER